MWKQGIIRKLLRPPYIAGSGLKQFSYYKTRNQRWQDLSTDK